MNEYTLAKPLCADNEEPKTNIFGSYYCEGEDLGCLSMGYTECGPLSCAKDVKICAI